MYHCGRSRGMQIQSGTYCRAQGRRGCVGSGGAAADASCGRAAGGHAARLRSKRGCASAGPRTHDGAVLAARVAAAVKPLPLGLGAPVPVAGAEDAVAGARRLGLVKLAVIPLLLHVPALAALLVHAVAGHVAVLVHADALARHKPAGQGQGGRSACAWAEARAGWSGRAAGWAVLNGRQAVDGQRWVSAPGVDLQAHVPVQVEALGQAARVLLAVGLPCRGQAGSVWGA